MTAGVSGTLPSHPGTQSIQEAAVGKPEVAYEKRTSVCLSDAEKIPRPLPPAPDVTLKWLPLSD